MAAQPPTLIPSSHLSTKPAQIQSWMCSGLTFTLFILALALGSASPAQEQRVTPGGNYTDADGPPPYGGYCAMNDAVPLPILQLPSFAEQIARCKEAGGVVRLCYGCNPSGCVPMGIGCFRGDPIKSILIQTKSFIARVDVHDSKQFADDAACGQGRMARLIDCAMLGGENPQTGDARSDSFRLQSELSGEATCSGDQLTDWSLHPVTIHAANEFYFMTTEGDLSPALTANPGTSGSNAAKVTFSYRMRGAPNVAGIRLMNKVKPRSCSKIWHRIDGELSCMANKLQVTYAVRSSAFPSVRSWNNGTLVMDRPQGPFKALWECDSAEPDLVR